MLPDSSFTRTLSSVKLPALGVVNDVAQANCLPMFWLA